MQKFIFAVYDLKTTLFSNPFFSVNANTAIRSFGAAANDPNTEICRFPSDFILYELGSFDDATGIFQIHTDRIYLGNAIQYQEVIIPKEVDANA